MLFFIVFLRLNKYQAKNGRIRKKGKGSKTRKGEHWDEKNNEKSRDIVYDEVMAVGSVDSNAEISASSSYGDDVDIMAPGELVKTVANFGMETVSSGTSMAAPHVVGVASVLWQIDKSKSVDFIRGLIEETANCIGDDENNYKIIDLEYALNMYHEYDENYYNLSHTIESNTSEIQVCDEMEQVTARWSKDNHEALVTNANNGILTTKQLNMVKLGIRYNDARLAYDSTNAPERDIWHALNTDTNYMTATYAVGKVIQEDDINPDNVTKAPGLTTNQWSQMKTDIKAIKQSNWSTVLSVKGLSATDYPYSAQNKRLILFGMSLHIITDAFAHRAWFKTTPTGRWDGWFHVGELNTTPDNITDIPSRYSAAGQVVKNAFNLALNPTVVKNSYTIRSRHIMYNNSYFDGSFALKQLMFMAKVNQANDSTYSTWYGTMANYTYTDVLAEQQEIDLIEQNQ